jgi:hypothetical protein
LGLTGDIDEILGALDGRIDSIEAPDPGADGATADGATADGETTVRCSG